MAKQKQLHLNAFVIIVKATNLLIIELNFKIVPLFQYFVSE